MVKKSLEVRVIGPTSESAQKPRRKRTIAEGESDLRESDECGSDDAMAAGRWVNSGSFESSRRKH